MNPIKQLRENRGWTQKTLARYADISRRTVSTIENTGKAAPYTKRKLIKALGLDYAKDSEWIFGTEKLHTVVLSIDDVVLGKLKAAVWDNDPLAYWTLNTLGKSLVDAINNNSAHLKVVEPTNVPS